MTWREGWLLGGLAALALASTWFLWSLQASFDGQPQANTGPQLIAARLHVTRFDAHGQREYSLVSPYLEQFAGQQGTWLREPQLTVFAQDQTERWLVEAERAWLAADNQRLQLVDQVIIDRPATSGEVPLRITTRDVLLVTATQTVATEAPVQLESATATMDAVGLRGDLKTQQWQLLNNVRARYASAVY